MNPSDFTVFNCPRPLSFRWRARWICMGLTWFCALVAASGPATASDHADPIDPLDFENLEAGITDLFVFPVGNDDQPVGAFERKAGIPLANTLADIVRDPLPDEERNKIESLVFILCVRRQLTKSGSLHLEPYQYRIHIDVDSEVQFPTSDDLEREEHGQDNDDYEGERGHDDHHGHDHDGQSDATSAIGYSAKGGPKQIRPTLVEAFARYGGMIANPDEIKEELVMEFQLDNKADLKAGFPKYSGSASVGFIGSKEIEVKTGVYDDPFIFPAFFGTNIVAMAVKIPVNLLPSERTNFLVWATSHEGKRQIDHVGRSLRTQNPRFELLNTLHPSKHVDAIVEEHMHPGLLRDIALRLNFAQTFAYRKWDNVPDVMCYSMLYPAGFPNGRLLTDDVAALLAQHGDTLLYELSYQHNNGAWPRQSVNDKDKDDVPGRGAFKTEFPYLLDPHEDRPPPAPLSLTPASWAKLIGIALVLIGLLVLENWIVARLYHRKQLRKRYL